MLTTPASNSVSKSPSGRFVKVTLSASISKRHRTSEPSFASRPHRRREADRHVDGREWREERVLEPGGA